MKAEKFGVSKGELKRAAQQAGDRAEAVRQHGESRLETRRISLSR